MSFAGREESKESGIPSALFYIKYGSEDSNYFAYTDCDHDIVRGGVTYSAIVIGRDKMASSGGLDNTTLEIDLTPGASVVQYYSSKFPSQVVTLTIFTTHADDPDEEVQTVWTGRILAVERGPRYAKISAEPIATSMRRPGLRRSYQYGCPWALYSEECGVDETISRVTATARVVGTNVVEIADGWEGPFDISRFVGGYLTWADVDDGSNQVRTIFGLNEGAGTDGDDQLILNGKTEGLETGTSLVIRLGCAHNLTDCGLHNNRVNFGGQPWIPKENPVGYINRYY